MTFGSMMAPAAQPPQQEQPQPANPNPDLVNQWMSYLSHPQIQAGLLQFAASVLQPVGMGESPLGRIGTALGEAGGAVDRVNQQQISEQQRAFENDQQVQAKKLQSRQVATEETRAATDQSRAATEKLQGEQRINISQQQVDAEVQRIKNELALGQGNLGLNARQLEEQARHNLIMEGLQTQDIASQGELRAAQSQYYKGFGLQKAGNLSAADRVAVEMQKGYMDNWRLDHPDATPGEEAAAFAQAQTIYPLTGGPAETAPTGAPTGQPGPAATDQNAPPAWDEIVKNKALQDQFKTLKPNERARAVQYYKSIDPKYDLEKLLGPSMKQVPYSDLGTVKPGEQVQLTGSPPMTYDQIVKKYGNPGLITDEELAQLKKDAQFISSDDLEKLYTEFPKLRKRMLGIAVPPDSSPLLKKK